MPFILVKMCFCNIDEAQCPAAAQPLYKLFPSPCFIYVSFSSLAGLVLGNSNLFCLSLSLSNIQKWAGQCCYCHTALCTIWAVFFSFIVKGKSQNRCIDDFGPLSNMQEKSLVLKKWCEAQQQWVLKLDLTLRYSETVFAGWTLFTIGTNALMCDASNCQGTKTGLHKPYLGW